MARGLKRAPTEEKGVTKRGWRVVCAVGSIVLLLAGCSQQAHYMRQWQPVERIAHRWTGGTLHEDKLSEDEVAVFRELGTPETIRFFRSVLERQRVYQWLYSEKEQIVWFVDGKRVDYVVVDTNTSSRTKAAREALQRKAIQGGLVTGFVGGIAAVFLLFDEDLGPSFELVVAVGELFAGEEFEVDDVVFV